MQTPSPKVTGSLLSLFVCFYQVHWHMFLCAVSTWLHFFGLILWLLPGLASHSCWLYSPDEIRGVTDLTQEFSAGDQMADNSLFLGMLGTCVPTKVILQVLPYSKEIPC